MTGYELELDQLRRAATAAQSGGDHLAGIDAKFMPAVYDVLPGSRCKKKFPTLINTWQQTVSIWSDALVNYAEDVTACANRYATNESDATKVFDDVHASGAEEY